MWSAAMRWVRSMLLPPTLCVCWITCMHDKLREMVLVLDWRNLVTECTGIILCDNHCVGLPLCPFTQKQVLHGCTPVVHWIHHVLTSHPKFKGMTESAKLQHIYLSTTRLFVTCLEVTDSRLSTLLS